MKIAYSPCPNDTFVFHAWAHGLIPGAPPLEVTYADINITNELAASGDGLDVMKISFAALPWVLEHYALLPCGGALGRGCGPLVLTNPIHGKNDNKHADPAQLTGRRVAVPSERSTAYLLFRLWATQHVPGGIGEIIIMPFHEIMPAVKAGQVDAGLVIHEARFTYQNYGLQLLADMGQWWEEDTGLPIPLGAIIAKRTLDTASIAEWARSSVEYAWSHPSESRDYIRSHAQEMDDDVTQAHIQLYVNEFTRDLGEGGYSAIEALLSRAAAEGLIPPIKTELLRKF